MIDWPNSPAALGGTVALSGELIVNRMGFGAMRICGPDIWGPPADHDEAIRVLRRAVELGINFIDTADSYGPNISELLIAEALHPYPPGLVIATKAGLVRPGPGEWKRNGHPAHLKAACVASLQRLRLERIDVFQLHAPDPQVPYADSVGALVDLQREGKIRYIGVSNVDVARLDEARAITRVVSVQNRYNLNDRLATPVLEECERDGLAFLPWYPLGGGPLTRSRGAIERIAERHAVTPAQVVLAWLLTRSPAMLPIPGTSSVPHLEENVAAAALRLTSADRRDLES
jgi:pyridoxine 4-dehydrogenase